MKKILYLFIGLALGFSLSSPAAQAIEGILAQRCTSPILLNGAPVEIEAYTINGHNYFKLRDIGKAVGFNVYWIAEDERYESKRVNRTPARHPLEPKMSSRIYSQDQTLPLLMWTL